MRNNPGIINIVLIAKIVTYNTAKITRKFCILPFQVLPLEKELFTDVFTKFSRSHPLTECVFRNMIVEGLLLLHYKRPLHGQRNS